MKPLERLLPSLTMLSVCKLLPTVLGDMVAKNVHELHMVDVHTEFYQQDLLMRRLEIIMQHYASADRIRVHMCKDGKVGQEVYLIHPFTDNEDQPLSSGDIGRSWNTFDEQTDDWMAFWLKDSNLTESDPEYHYTDEDWNQYSNWTSDDGNYGDGFSRVRLMLHHLPDHPDFDELDELRSSDNFLTYYPGFLPVYVTLPTHCISTTEIPLNNMQLAIKYEFTQTLTQFSELMRGHDGLNQYQSHDVMVSAIELLMKNPTMLIHYPVFRRVFMRKMEELLDFIRSDVQKKTTIGKHSTRSFQAKYDHIEKLIWQMKDVLKGIKMDPNYAE